MADQQGFAQRFAANLAENIKKQQAEREAAQAAQGVTPQSQLQITKPDSQEILEHRILWVWREPGNESGWILCASYFTSDEGEFKAGEYVVNINLNELILTGVNTGALGAALISAAHWENLWGMHMGSFLMVAKKAEAEFTEEMKEAFGGDGRDQLDQPETVVPLKRAPTKRAARKKAPPIANGQGTPVDDGN